MKNVVLLLLLCVLLSQNLVLALDTDPVSITTQETELKTQSCQPINNENETQQTSLTTDFPKNKYSCLEGKELEAIKLEKGRKFIVRSEQPMNSESPIGTLIDFTVIRDVDIFYNGTPSKVVFTGEIIENKPPRLGGRSSTLKLLINKIKVDNITYPAEAYITKMGKKQIFAGVLAGAPVYFMNLGDVANKGTVTIDKVYKDPCQYSCESITSVLRPAYYLGGAILQLADLLISPIVCFFLPGKEIDIPEKTAFEIKLENDISLLKL